MDRLTGLSWMFERVAHLCPLLHVSDVFHILHGIYQTTIQQQEDGKADEDQEQFEPYEFISPYLKHNKWGKDPSDHVCIPLIFNFPKPLDPKFIASKAKTLKFEELFGLERWAQ